MHFKSEDLKPQLDALYHTYNRNYLHTDPVNFVHRYTGQENREIVGILSASLAYGNVKQILSSIEKVVAPLGPSPVDFVRNLDIRETTDRYRGFVHRFNTGKDIALLLYYLHQIYNRYATLEEFFLERYARNDATIESALSAFSERILSLDSSPFYPGKPPDKTGIRFLLSNPANKSACKRMNMFLRWMVRPDDGVDFGLWKNIDASKLVIPLDSHTARICRYIGLSKSRTASWRMALEVTANLRIFEPDDPVKYDFALSRLGILAHCKHRYVDGICEECKLFTLCHLTENARMN